jgi:hypothetical protein
VHSQRLGGRTEQPTKHIPSMRQQPLCEHSSDLMAGLLPPAPHTRAPLPRSRKRQRANCIASIWLRHMQNACGARMIPQAPRPPSPGAGSVLAPPPPLSLWPLQACVICGACSMDAEKRLDHRPSPLAVSEVPQQRQQGPGQHQANEERLKACESQPLHATMHSPGCTNTGKAALSTGKAAPNTGKAAGDCSRQTFRICPHLSILDTSLGTFTAGAARQLPAGPSLHSTRTTARAAQNHRYMQIHADTQLQQQLTARPRSRSPAARSRGAPGSPRRTASRCRPPPCG